MKASTRERNARCTDQSPSRRDLFRLAGGIALLGHGVSGNRVAAQQPDNHAVDALYDPAAAMPHLTAEFVFPFVRRNWQMNGRGVLHYSLESAVQAEAVTAADAELLGAPSAMYTASIIAPQGESWSTARYLTIASYANPDAATEAAARFVSSGVPDGGTDLTVNLDPSLGQAISYAVTADLSGTPAEQVFSVFAAGNWLFRHSSLTPQTAAAADLTKARSVGAIPLAVGEDVAEEALALAAVALAFDSPEDARALMQLKGYSDEDINSMSPDLFPFRFAETAGARIDYVKHNNRDYVPYGVPNEATALQQDYYAEAMCVVADEGPIPPANQIYYYSVKRFFSSDADARAAFDAMPTLAQQASHQAGGVTFQDDPEGSDDVTKASHIIWQPPGAPNALPGYGIARARGPIVSTFNAYHINPSADGPTVIDPAHSLYESLRTGVLDIHSQQKQFEANLSGWPVYRTPEAFSG